MPRGPNGERLPADVAPCAVSVARTATGEDEETSYKQAGKCKGVMVGEEPCQCVDSGRT